jgi:hypothetical protein
VTWAIKKFKGRFANQLLQYARLRQLGSHACCPWIGQRLFGLDDETPPPGSKSLTDFPKHSTQYDLAQMRAIFQPVPSVRYRARTLIDMLRGQDHTLIGMHLRRGDYGTFQRKSARWCFVAPAEWYTQWISVHYSRLRKPVFILCSDEPDKVAQDFRSYNVVQPGSTVPEAPYYSDFYALTQCDILLISNSTFGFAAAMLNENLQEAYRPRLSMEMLVPFDVADAPLVFKDEKY